MDDTELDRSQCRIAREAVVDVLADTLLALLVRGAADDEVARVSPGLGTLDRKDMVLT